MESESNTELLVSLVVPLRNEGKSITRLVNSINRQTFLPAEVVFVDGGSTDDTLDILNRIAEKDSRVKVISVPNAYPGVGRNIGSESASSAWLAYTDGGIELDKHWLKNLVSEVNKEPEVSVIYGEVEPIVRTFFDRIATLTYVPAKKPDTIRTRFIASSLMQKEVWEKTGGFPNLRAAEDLIFMETVEALGFRTATAPQAKALWELRPDLLSTFRKFVLYSKHNVLAGRQWDWHYGILRQYLLLIPLLLLAYFISSLWLLAVPAWLLVRAGKRIFAHRFEFGFFCVFNPFYLIGVGGLLTVIDIATFVGWLQAKLFSSESDNG